MLIRLNDLEMEFATRLGEKRHAESANLTPSRGQPVEASLGHHKMGACGELAAAKALNLYPGFTVNNFHGPDIEPNIQVRASRKPRLIMTRKDNPFQKYVLVVGEAPNLEVAGWMWGYEGQEPRFFLDPNNGRPPAYFIPKEALRPMSTFNES